MTKYVAIGVIAIILAAAVYAYMSYSSGNANQETDTNVPNQAQVQEKGADQSQSSADVFTGTMADLAARGGSWQCAVDASNQFARSGGTVFVSGSRLRGDFTSAVSVQGFNQTVESHLIQDGGYAYVWTSVAPQGFKMKATAGGEGKAADTSGQGVDLNQQYTYDCEPWVVDASVFVLPQGVTFTE